MRVGYCRVSTKAQKLDLQLDALHGVGCEKIYRDEGVSGAKTSRPGLDACLASLKAGDCLVVWKLDRLGRSLAHVMELLREFETRGVDFKSMTEGFDTTTAAGKLLFHIIGSLAQFEREITHERIMAGLEAARASGTKLGRKFSIPPETITEAIKMRDCGASFKEIAKELHISKASAYRLIGGHRT